MRTACPALGCGRGRSLLKIGGSKIDGSMNRAKAQMTAPEFAALKGSGRKITMLTAYDYTTARLVDEAGVEGVLVGDSLGMVVQGRENTLPVTLEQMIYHAEMVGRAVGRALVVADLPFPINTLAPEKTVDDAGRLLKETNVGAVKLEGGVEQAGVIQALVAAGMPVMAHCGLRPQTVRQLGGYRVQRDRDRLLADAEAAEAAGAFGIVLECIPVKIAAEITERLRIPTIGIGAGPDCDGQILVINDILGLTENAPRFVKPYADLKSIVGQAVGEFRDEVRDGVFPGPDHSFK